MRVLLVEDDTDMLDVTSYALRKHGYEVSGLTDGATAVERWHKDQPDLVLLDVNLPNKSGMDICREIRKLSSTPIIMVTAMGDEAHIVEGFDAGADDYVSKPVSYRELAMRMRAVLQRRTGAPIVETSTIAESGDVRVDLSAHEVSKAERLVEFVWNYDGGDAFALKTHLCHIRQKLDIAKGSAGYISSVPHVGYTLKAA
jgi:two-component system, OmpR family, response regulator RegX3